MYSVVSARPSEEGMEGNMYYLLFILFIYLFIYLFFTMVNEVSSAISNAVQCVFLYSFFSVTFLWMTVLLVMGYRVSMINGCSDSLTLLLRNHWQL